MICSGANWNNWPARPHNPIPCYQVSVAVSLQDVLVPKGGFLFIFLAFKAHFNERYLCDTITPIAGSYHYHEQLQFQGT